MDMYHLYLYVLRSLWLSISMRTWRSTQSYWWRRCNSASSKHSQTIGDTPREFVKVWWRAFYSPPDLGNVWIVVYLGVQVSNRKFGMQTRWRIWKGDNEGLKGKTFRLVTPSWMAIWPWTLQLEALLNPSCFMLQSPAHLVRQLQHTSGEPLQASWSRKCRGGWNGKDAYRSSAMCSFQWSRERFGREFCWRKELVTLEDLQKLPYQLKQSSGARFVQDTWKSPFQSWVLAVLGEGGGLYDLAIWIIPSSTLETS